MRYLTHRDKFMCIHGGIFDSSTFAVAHPSERFSIGGASGRILLEDEILGIEAAVMTSKCPATPPLKKCSKFTRIVRTAPDKVSVCGKSPIVQGALLFTDQGPAFHVPAPGASQSYACLDPMSSSLSHGSALSGQRDDTGNNDEGMLRVQCMLDEETLANRPFRLYVSDVAQVIEGTTNAEGRINSDLGTAVKPGSLAFLEVENENGGAILYRFRLTDEKLGQREAVANLGYARAAGAQRLGSRRIVRKQTSRTRTVKDWREEAWELFIKYEPQVQGRITIADAKELNRRVTASYSKMYLSKPTVFKWAGMAAFASAEVGRGMQRAWQLGFTDWTLNAGSTVAIWIGGLIKTGESVGPMLGKKLFWALSAGNRFVWWDIMWQHFAYQEEGISALVRAAKAGDLSTSVLKAWEKINDGSKRGDQSLVWRGNAELLRYEQEVVLQQRVYNRTPDIWSAISDDVPSPIPGHDVKFTAAVPGGNIAKFSERWKWIEQSMLPAWKALEGKQHDRVKAMLEAMI